jgi:hypothetical protein
MFLSFIVNLISELISGLQFLFFSIEVVSLLYFNQVKIERIAGIALIITSLDCL